jgi:hypothetical protein
MKKFKIYILLIVLSSCAILVPRKDKKCTVLGNKEFCFLKNSNINEVFTRDTIELIPYLSMDFFNKDKREEYYNLKFHSYSSSLKITDYKVDSSYFDSTKQGEIDLYESQLYEVSYECINDSMIIIFSIYKNVNRIVNDFDDSTEVVLERISLNNFDSLVYEIHKPKNENNLLFIAKPSTPKRK